jgi:hypothetical protein
MRLLKLRGTESFSLVEFLGSDVPPYAILSHTWGPSNEEVTYQDLKSIQGRRRLGPVSSHSAGSKLQEMALVTSGSIPVASGMSPRLQCPTAMEVSAIENGGCSIKASFARLITIRGEAFD